MNRSIVAFLLYFGRSMLFTLGVLVICGFAVRLCAVLFARLSGRASGRAFDLTAVVGTPVHELGHAVMCLVFGHRITRIKLWSPFASDGVYGYVEHSYNRKNPWAVLGNLPIALGPIFSGLGTILLMLWLCFPAQWSGYLASSHALLEAGVSFDQGLRQVLSLLLSLPAAFATSWLRAALGLAVILSVSLHISLSWQDVKGAALALPIYSVTMLAFCLISYFLGAAEAVTEALRLFAFRLLSLFCVVIAFCFAWVLLALVVRLIKIVISWF